MTLSTLTVSLLSVTSLVTGTYVTELTRYTESVILELALQSPGTFECVFFDMHPKHSFDVVLGDLLRSPELDHVVKYVIGGNFNGDPWTYPRHPALVVIHAGDSYHDIRQVPKKINQILFQFESPTKVLILVDMLDGECFWLMNDIVASLRFSKMAFLGSNRKMVIRLTNSGHIQSVWEHFPALEELLSSNVRDMHGFPISFTTINPRYNDFPLDDLMIHLKWFDETAEYLNTSIIRYKNPCKTIDGRDICLHQLLNDKRIDITLDRLFPAENCKFPLIYLNVPDTNVIMVPRGRLLDVFEIFLAPLTTGAWIVLLVIIVFLEMISVGMPKLFRNNPTLLLICGLEKYDLHKSNRWEKMVLLAFIIFFFLLKNGYETKIISMMTSKPSLKTAKTTEEMLASGIKVKLNFNHVGNMDLGFLDGSLVNSSDQLVNMDGESAYLGTRSKAEIYLPLLYFDNYLHRMSYEIMDQTLDILIPALVSNHHNPVKEILEWSYQSFLEAGLFGYLTEKHKLAVLFTYNRRNTATYANDMLTINGMLPAWLALGFGSAISFLILIGELLVGWFDSKRIELRRIVLVTPFDSAQKYLKAMASHR